MYKINTVISKVDDKRVFRGKIKGQRQYWANTKKATKFGRSVNRTMKKAGSTIGQVPVIGILGVVPRAIGVVTLAGNSVVSPAISVFKKGKHSSVRRGTVFEIKLSEDVKLKA